MPKQTTMTLKEFREKHSGVKEDDLQQLVMLWARTQKLLCLQTTHRVKAVDCPQCSHKFRPGHGYGSSPGVPDLLIRSDDWPSFFWLGIELKGSKTAVSAAQKELSLRSAVAICRSLEEVQLAVQSARDKLNAILEARVDRVEHFSGEGKVTK